MAENQMHNPAPAEVLAAAEQERHVLLEQAARDHLSIVRAEARRYEAALEHIESVFRLRLLQVSRPGAS